MKNILRAAILLVLLLPVGKVWADGVTEITSASQLVSELSGNGHYLIVNDEDYGGLGGLELQQAMANDSRNLPVTQNYLEFIQTVSQIDSINKFLADQFDVDGNILLKNDSVLPIFRGGFYDRFGNYYDTKISNRLGPLNITVN